MGTKLESIKRNQKEIIQVLRIVTVFILAILLSFVLLFYGIFSAETYIGGILCIFLSIYILLPVVFRFCPYLQQLMVFQCDVDASGVDFDNPEGLKGVRNLKLTNHQGISLGIWHLLPLNNSIECEGKDATYWESCIKQKDHKGVIIYFHGVTGTRGKPHRKELYKVFQAHGHHVICCDYRGFGDSTKVERITETGVVADALQVYKWVREELLHGCNDIPLFVWGHSLGAGISTHLLGKLRDGTLPHGLVLESPFDNFAEELRNHSKLKLWSSLPFFDALVIKPLLQNDIAFKNDVHISKISVPIMILHCKDDHVVPSYLGRRLYEVGKQKRSQEANPLYFVHMNAGRHNEMYRDNSDIFENIVKSFTSACLVLDQLWYQRFSHLELEILSSHNSCRS